MNFSGFLANDSIRNIWLNERGMKVYVRRSIRLLDEKSTAVTPCLDIASVEVKEDSRGKGIFTAFLKRFEVAAKNAKRAVYIESIQNPRFVKYLLRNGYKMSPRSNDIAPNMFKNV